MHKQMINDNSLMEMKYGHNPITEKRQIKNEWFFRTFKQWAKRCCWLEGDSRYYHYVIQTTYNTL